MQALQNQPITLYGDGSQTRSFCYVDDLIDALIRLMDSPDDFVGPINIGNPVEFTIRELAETVIQLTNSQSSLVFKPLPSDDPKQRQPDASLAKQVLNWSASTPLSEGLKQTIRYFETLLTDGDQF
jgi:UDP-glucuronate decarboxylase